MSDDEVRRARLPDDALPTTVGERVALRARRMGTVLVLVDETGARERDYLRTLAAEDESLRGWDGRTILVARDRTRAEALAGLGFGFPVAIDEGGVVASAAGVSAPAVVIGDQWGEVHAAAAVTDDGAWMSLSDVEQWLRFMAIRCAG